MRTKIKWLLTLIIIISCKIGFAYKEHYLLSKDFSADKIKPLLVLNQRWVKYPAYTDRDAWSTLLKNDASEYIKKGENYLDYEWKYLKVTDYLAFERTGERDIMQDISNANNAALTSLFMAELAEGKGRFIDQIINGTMLLCERSTWVMSAHVHQAAETVFPNHKDYYIDLGAGNIAGLLSWVYYYLSPEFDKVDPLFSQRLYHELKTRILDSYLNDDTFWWLATDWGEKEMVNNWNPWCNSNCLLTFMLLENDPERLSKAVYKSMVSVDKFINYTKEDGACEEGPGYWGHAAGKMYDYLDMLHKITDGKVSVFNDPMIKAKGEYIANSYVGDGWVVNFADASAKGGGDPRLIYRYGKAVNSDIMMSYAKNIASGKSDYINPSMDISRTLEAIMSRSDMNIYNKAFHKPDNVWYPQTEFLFMNDNSGMFLAAKGGFNAESHNHNDVGSFALYIDSTPLFIDIGVGTYTKFTFNEKRYDLFYMQSNYHNLPLINGFSQKDGFEYKSRNTEFNETQRRLSIDIAGAYLPNSGIDSWIRSYQLSGNKLEIEDKFSLSFTKESNQINFVTWGQVDISLPGRAIIEVEGKKVELKYDAKVFKADLETIVLDDKRLSSIWGDKIFRISLNAKNKQFKGKYKYTISKLQ